MFLKYFVQGTLLRFVIPRYMKGRLTTDKVNAAINDMAAYADVNFQLITAPRKKVLHLLSVCFPIIPMHYRDCICLPFPVADRQYLGESLGR